MSEKIYALLLRLYPSGFRRKYEAEALQLMRDRLRDETGFLRRARLWYDLMADGMVGIPQAYRIACADKESASLSLNVNGHPPFGVLDREPLQPGLILVGGALALAVLFAFSFVISRPVTYQPPAGSSAPMSPIESVLHRLNRAAFVDSAAHDRHEVDKSTSPAEAGTSTSQVSKAPLAASKKQDDYVATNAVNIVDQPNVGARGVALTLRPVVQNDQSPAEQPRLENASSAMIQLFQTHDIVMFGEVHGSKQEYEWLCKLVNTPEFDDRVDDIVVEFGNALDQKTVDRYIAGEDVPFNEVQKAWRNMVASVGPVSPVYGKLYEAVRDANMKRHGRHPIRLLMGSPPGDWDKIRSSADLAPYESERERWYAQVVKDEVLARHHRALLIMGAGHFLRGNTQALNDELLEQQHREVPPVDKSQLGPGYIERELRSAGASPYVVVLGTNAIDDRGDVDKRFDSWPVPVIVPLAGNWVGALHAQPVISGGHARATPLTLAEQADALLYVAPCKVLSFVNVPRSEVDGTAYGAEIARRDAILVGHPANPRYGEVPQCIPPAPSH